MLIINKAPTQYLRQVTQAVRVSIQKPAKGPYLMFQLRQQADQLLVQTIQLQGQFRGPKLGRSMGIPRGSSMGVGYDILCKRSNHTNPAVTIRYLRIEDKEVNGILMNEI